MISIIIPVLNEVDTIAPLLRYLTENSTTPSLSEVLVVDGGSTDGTQKTITEFSESVSTNIELIHSKKGRAIQMNAGARAARGRILYFLHADSFPPKGFDATLMTAVEKGNTAGCFRMKFDSNHVLLKCSQWFTRFNVKICRGGDQSLFITKELFDRLQGFDENYIVFEDCEFINRLYDLGQFTVLPQYVITSSRKYKKIGTWTLQYHFAVIHIKYWLGVRYKGLHTYYQKHIVKT
jgi:rSAM/selenodomain-associated transferase 2